MNYSPSGYNQQANIVSPRKQLQGQRPSSLVLNKDSHGIKKPPAGPPKRPVIIYMRSPKIIHTKAQDFMALVQRLTGRPPKAPSSSSSSTSSLSSLPATGLPEAPSSSYLTSLSLDGVPASVGIRQEVTDLDIEPYLSDNIIINAKPTEMLPLTGILSPAPSFLPQPPPTLFQPSLKQLASPNLLELSPIHYTPNYHDTLFMSSLQGSYATTPPPPMSLNSANSSCLDVASLSDLYRIQ